MPSNQNGATGKEWTPPGEIERRVSPDFTVVYHVSHPPSGGGLLYCCSCFHPYPVSLCSFNSHARSEAYSLSFVPLFLQPFRSTLLQDRNNALSRCFDHFGARSPRVCCQLCYVF